MRRRMLDNFVDRDWPEFEAEVAVPVDVKVEDDSYVITALLPGLKSEDLNIQVVNGSVTIQGEFKSNREEGATYLVQERFAGRFSRTITLPEPLNTAKAEADLSNGVLTLRVPKAEEAKPRSIKIISKN
jgi:HSP20 family protein